MATKIESTVRQVAEDLAKAAFSGGQRVQLLVLDDVDEAKLVDLRSAIAEADASEDVDSVEAFDEIQRVLAKKFPVS